MSSVSNSAEAATEVAEEGLYRRLAWRIMPMLFIGYVIAYLDRVNLGFAKLQMMDDLKFSETVYGIGAGVFFLGYFLFEVPSNIILHKIGARVWICRVMVVWGIVSACTAFVTEPWQFYTARAALGVAEAGFFPGLVLYLTYWFPSHRRGKMMAVLMAGNPVSGMIGGPLSGGIMNQLEGYRSFAGWQWMFILEAIPAIVLGVIIFARLEDSIAASKWLSPSEKNYLSSQIDAEARGKTQVSMLSSFKTWRVWLMCAILFGIVMGSYGIGFWQPAIIKQSGVTNNFTIGLLTIIPYALALICMLLNGRHADETHERRWHVILPALVGASGFVLLTQTGGSTLISMVGLSLAAIGVISALPMFWALPTSFLGGGAAAAGIALINCTGNLAGFVSPAVVGYLKTQTGTLDSGLYLIAGSLLMSAILILFLVPARLVSR